MNPQPREGESSQVRARLREQRKGSARGHTAKADTGGMQSQARPPGKARRLGHTVLGIGE